jgi:CRISPR-associated protein Csb2
VNQGQERALIVRVHLLGDRWHGTVDWPPSPFRLFQALIAGAYGGRWQCEGDERAPDAAFSWLESLPPPVIGRPVKRDARVVQYFVPNNDLDAVGGDPRRTASIRTPKLLRSVMFDAPPSFVFAWRFTGEEWPASDLVELCDRLHTFGRGVDAAYATARIAEVAEVEEEFSRYSLRRCEPSEGVGGGEAELPCPQPGSLRSLQQRYRDTQRRLSGVVVGGNRRTQFRQPDKADFRTVAYGVPPTRVVFELQELDEAGRFYPYRLELVVPLTLAIRDLAFSRLSSAMGRAAEFERVLLGRECDDRLRAMRVRFIPLPSIGTEHTDPSIRRALIELPPECPVEASDLRWALAGQRLPALTSKEGYEGRGGARLVESVGNDMLCQYGIVGRPSDRWRTVTPAVLPIRLRRGRRSGSERRCFEEIAALSVADAIRHAGIGARVTEVRMQREPFITRGKRADAFDSNRFEVGRLRHVELVLDEPCRGPLLLGDGRWVGLGLLSPVRRSHDDAEEIDGDEKSQGDQGLEEPIDGAEDEVEAADE